jgi:hypothetical protein
MNDVSTTFIETAQHFAAHRDRIGVAIVHIAAALHDLGSITYPSIADTFADVETRHELLCRQETFNDAEWDLHDLGMCAVEADIPQFHLLGRVTLFGQVSL